MPSASWETLFAALQAYKARFGHCDVPTQWPENPPLGAWVANQRQMRKKETLDEARVKLLGQLGFKWQLRRSPPDRAPRRTWEEMLRRLEVVRPDFSAFWG
jgi:hypothetical protein